MKRLSSMGLELHVLFTFDTTCDFPRVTAIPLFRMERVSRAWSVLVERRQFLRDGQNVLRSRTTATYGRGFRVHHWVTALHSNVRKVLFEDAQSPCHHPDFSLDPEETTDMSEAPGRARSVHKDMFPPTRSQEELPRLSADSVIHDCSASTAKFTVHGILLFV